MSTHPSTHLPAIEDSEYLEIENGVIVAATPAPRNVAYVDFRRDRTPGDEVADALALVTEWSGSADIAAERAAYWASIARQHGATDAQIDRARSGSATTDAPAESTDTGR